MTSLLTQLTALGLTAVAMLPGVVLPQGEPERARLIGSVHGRGGSAWGGATVTLHGEPAVPLPGFGAAETLEIRTDDQGRFGISLLRDRSYAVWAVRAGGDGFAVTEGDGFTVTEGDGFAVTEGDGFTVTEIATGVRPARPLSLRESSARTMPVRVRVLGLDAWRGVGVPGLFVRDGLGRRRALELDEHGEADLGRLGGESCELEVCDAEGRPLYRQQVGLTHGSRQRALDRLAADRASRHGEPLRGLPDLLAEDAPPIDLERVLLGPPLRCRMRFVDDEESEPIAGVEVLLDVHYDRWRGPRSGIRLGIEPVRAHADDEGRVEFVVPTPISRWGRPSTTTQVLFIGRARGFELKQLGWAKSRPGATEITGKELIAGVTDEVTAAMRRGYVMRGRVIGTAALPATAVSIVCELPGAEKSGPRSSWGFHTFEVARPKADGRWEIHGVGQRSSDLSASLVLPPELIAKLGGDSAVPVSPILALGRPTGGNLDDLERDVRVDAVELDELRITDLEVTEPDGGPAQLARVQVHRTRWTMQRHGLIDQLGYTDDPYARRGDAFTDRRGRCRILTATDSAFVLIEGAEHYAFEELSLAPAPGPRKIVLKPYGKDRLRPRRE